MESCIRLKISVSPIASQFPDLIITLGGLGGIGCEKQWGAETGYRYNVTNDSLLTINSLDGSERCVLTVVLVTYLKGQVAASRPWGAETRWSR